MIELGPSSYPDIFSFNALVSQTVEQATTTQSYWLIHLLISSQPDVNYFLVHKFKK